MSGDSKKSNVLQSVAAGLPVIGQGLSAIFQSGANRKSRKFAEKMYYQQRKDALNFWNMQNEYNSPEAQMQRFKDAGLNPNLIYGRGSSGEAGAVNVPNQPRWNPAAPRLNLGEVANSFYNAKIKSAQVGLLDAQRVATLVNAASSQYDLQLRMAAKESLLAELSSRGEQAFQDIGLTAAKRMNLVGKTRNELQAFKFLQKYNPKQIAQIQQAINRSMEQGKLNFANLRRLIKTNKLIGISDKTEVGSLMRALLTIFGQDSQFFNK